MHRLIKISLSFVALLMVFSFANPEKKIQKLIHKIWKNTEFTLQHIDLNNPIDDLSQLNAIVSDNDLLGYVCYTYSHGCRIGGCSAPSSSTDDSYEVFEYIVIYDTNLSILKIDIAEYGGEYGYEICRSKWLKQFEGETVGFMLNENIDGISGATVSATYLIDDLNKLGKKMRILRTNKII